MIIPSFGGAEDVSVGVSSYFFSFWPSKDRSLDRQGSSFAAFVSQGSIIVGWRINPWFHNPENHANNSSSSTSKTSKSQCWPRNDPFLLQKSLLSLPLNFLKCFLPKTLKNTRFPNRIHSLFLTQTISHSTPFLL